MTAIYLIDASNHLETKEIAGKKNIQLFLKNEKDDSNFLRESRSIFVKSEKMEDIC